jgi:hypothetical protein
MANPKTAEIGSPLNASIVTGEAVFYPSSGAAGMNLGNIIMHKNAGKATTKDRAISVRGGGRRLANRQNTLAELSYEVQLDEQTIENMAIVLFGTATVQGYSQDLVAAPAGTASLSSSNQRSVYDLGKLSVVTVVVKDAVPTAYVEGADYSVDYQLGTIYIIDGGGIVDGTALTITFGCAALKMDTIQALTTINRNGRFVLVESDVYTTSSGLFKNLWDGNVVLTPTAFAEENADFSKFSFTVTFTGQPTIKRRPWVAS